MGFIVELINTKLQVKNEDNAKYKGLALQRSFYNIVLRSIFVTLILCYINRIQGIGFSAQRKRCRRLVKVCVCLGFKFLQWTPRVCKLVVVRDDDEETLFQ